MAMKYSYGIIVLVVIALLLWIAVFSTKKERGINEYIHTTRVDTVIVRDTIYLQKTYFKTKLRITYDTLRDTISTLPFVAQLDTIDYITCDTLSIRYTYPANEFEYILRRKPILRDTQYIYRYDTLRINTVRQEVSNGYLQYIIGAIGGFIIGRSIK